MQPVAAPGLLVRFALPTQAQAVYPLVEALARATDEAPPHPTAFAAAFERSFGSDARPRFVVAERGGRVVGCATLHASTTAWRGVVLEMRDDALAPGEPEATRRELVAFAERHGRAIGAVRLEARARPSATEGHASAGLAPAPYVLLAKDLRVPDVESPF